MSEHQLTFIKIKAAASLALLVLAIVAVMSARPCDEPEEHAAQAKAQRMASADAILGIERK
jgi:hypothetical protein